MSVLRRPINLLGIEFAPILEPLEKRLQTLVVATLLHIFYFGGFTCLFVAIGLLFTPLSWVTLLYAVWYLYDRETPDRGGRPSTRLRNWAVWQYAADYFPATLHKTVDLAPDRNYVFCYHPHGVPAFGACLNFVTNSTGFSSKFPGLTPRLVVLRGNFQFPFYRELALLFGTVSSSSESISYLLERRRGVGRVITLIVGGAREVLYAEPGEHVLVLRKRKGFVRLALQHGASLVPVFSFGEVNMYKRFADNGQGSWVRRAQETLMRLTGIPLPTAYGRGVFNYSLGTVPFSTPLNAVVGSPIHVDPVDHPTEAQVDLLHARYIELLTQLFETHKHKFGLTDSDKLTIV